MFLHRFYYFPLLLSLCQWRQNEFESGGTGPERKWGHRSGAKVGVTGRRNIFFGRVPPLFRLYKYKHNYSFW